MKKIVAALAIASTTALAGQQFDWQVTLSDGNVAKFTKHKCTAKWDAPDGTQVIVFDSKGIMYIGCGAEHKTKTDEMAVCYMDNDKVRCPDAFKKSAMSRI